MTNQKPIRLLCANAFLAGLALISACSSAVAETPAPGTPGNPFIDSYAGYTPPFLDILKDRAFDSWQRSDGEMKLSSEKSFFTLCRLHVEDRANALVEAGIQCEKQRDFRGALKIYRKLFDNILDHKPDLLIRVSPHGVFVPVAQYVQRRILNFPKEDLAFYRSLFDARAKALFDQARRSYSLPAYSRIVDSLLASSYGDNALLELGNSALDSGRFLEALEYFETIRRFFPESDCLRPEFNLKMEFCRKVLKLPASRGASKNGRTTTLSSEDLKRLKRIVASANPEKRGLAGQRASAPYVSADDYALFPTTRDPLGIDAGVWTHDLPGSRKDLTVYTQPVVTDDSVIYRHKNIVYCRSILNGTLRWKSDLGGRVTWQSRAARQYPQEDVLVHEGMVFTVMRKGGPSLVALDQITGQLKWAHGPMVASTEEEANLRFESAPAGGPRMVYAGYTLDNIQGDAHTDSEYGIMAFDSATGRVAWRRKLCRLYPGKFASAFGHEVRNRIRSFASPPLFHQGTVYHTTNAGAIAALDALSGRVKWLIRYPCYPEVHDATERFGRGAGGKGDRHFSHSPMFWYGQRPLVVGDQLYVLPVDAPFLFAMDRRTGKIRWSMRKHTQTRSEPYNKIRIGETDGGPAYFLGPASTGELVVVYSSRGYQVHLIDPRTGKTTWTSPDLIERDLQPVMHLWIRTKGFHSLVINGWRAQTAARPLLTQDGKLHVSSFAYNWKIGHACFLSNVDLKARKVVSRRRYYTGDILGHAHRLITADAPADYRRLNEMRRKQKQIVENIKKLKQVMEDHLPTNQYGPFVPFSRVTFTRNGVPFELRFGARQISMCYDRGAVEKALAGRRGAEADYARAELAVGDRDYEKAHDLLVKCLKQVSPDDQDLRATIHQILYRVHRNLCRMAIRTGRVDLELQQALGMSRTANTLTEEVETLFALAEACERKGDLSGAARHLRNIVGTYGHHEYPTVALNTHAAKDVTRRAEEVISHAKQNVHGRLYREEMVHSLGLLKGSLPLYWSTVSPLPKTLTVRAGEWAARSLDRLRAKGADSAARFEEEARAALKGKSCEVQRHRLWEFPGTDTARSALERLFKEADATAEGPKGRLLWELADVARVSRHPVPRAYHTRVSAPASIRTPAPLNGPFHTRSHTFEDTDGALRLVLQRRDDGSQHPEFCFFGSRVRKRLSYKFVLECMNLETGKIIWKGRENRVDKVWTDQLRLRGTGQEAGFFEAYVANGLVVVHGLYDVMAFNVEDGKLKWHYRVPFNFEIEDAAYSGDVMVLCGADESICLLLRTTNPNGTVLWQEKEHGGPYMAPYFRGDRFVTVRQIPYNVTVRYRASGKLMGRLELPDLTQVRTHPLLENGPEALPVAHAGDLLALTDGVYYIAVDVARMHVRWKRLIDMNDTSKEPAMRFALSDEHLLVVKEDYDLKSAYMLSARTGRILWHTDPKKPGSPRPSYSNVINGGVYYGLEPHPSKAFYLVGRDAATGKLLFRHEEKGYGGKPKVALQPHVYGDSIVARVADRQDFQLVVFNVKQKGKREHEIDMKGVGPFGVHGRMSCVVQCGHAVLLGKKSVSY